MENMTSAMQNYEKWYRENVNLSFTLFYDYLTSDGYAQHWTNDGRLFKATLTTDGEVSVLITNSPITTYKEDCKFRIDDIIRHMIDNMDNGQFSVPTMDSGEIAYFANWVVNDVNIADCGLTFDTFTHYVMYEDDFEIEINELIFSNNEDKSSKLDEIAAELEISSDKIKMLTKRLLDLVNEGGDLI